MGYPEARLRRFVFRMEQAGLSPRDLIPPLWAARAKVSEVPPRASGRLPMPGWARALHTNLGIPADVLLQQPGGELPERT